MELTEEQKSVVGLSSGRHIVLAPPGSGKTEMLSRRIINAVKSGVEPRRMLCATFTNRAAFEMRDRVLRDGGDLVLPDVGNLHHFCHSFLKSIGRFQKSMHVLDEIQQEEFIKEVIDVLRFELRECALADIRRTHGVTVIRSIKGSSGPSVDDASRDFRELNPRRVEHLREVLDSYFAEAVKNGRNPYAEILSGVCVSHQRRIGIPSRLLRPYPPQTAELASEGLIDGIERVYCGLKRKFRCLDFDDLLNNTYLFLQDHPLAEERKYCWVQIDEVQDLNPIQWSIVKSLTAVDGVSVYFGDCEQAIFSFLGASVDAFAVATADCEKHFFKKNFRATPYLLEILMRYSLENLQSGWSFLPVPAGSSDDGGVLKLIPATTAGTSHVQKEKSDFSEVVKHVEELISSGRADNAAILVRTNKAADLCEDYVKRLGRRYAKVSGVDLFSYAPMRDFMAFVSLFAGDVSMSSWSALARRFSRVVFSRAQARYFIRGMYASGWNPAKILDKRGPVGFSPLSRSRASRWAWRNRRAIANLHATLCPASRVVATFLGKHSSFRDLFDVFAGIAFSERQLYSSRELNPHGLVDGDGLSLNLSYREGVEIAKGRIDKFLRYVDSVYASDSRPLGKILEEDWSRLSKLKEADLLVGDEQIIISTIHKAKGRQFDAVLVPDVSDIVLCPCSDPDEAKRLLYVAMSRAKRHLLLWNADTSVVKTIGHCFTVGYENYYMRKRRGDDLSKDWLSQWESLADMNARNVCDDAFVFPFAGAPSGAVARMAVYVLRRSGNEPFRNKAYSEILETETRTEVLNAVVDSLADCAVFDRDMVNRVRDRVVDKGSSSLSYAALRYFMASASSVKHDAVDAIGDLIYSRFPEVRSAAAEKLFLLGEMRYAQSVTGSSSDFNRLALIDDPAHEPCLRRILDCSYASGKYEKHLRSIIEKRALR